MLRAKRRARQLVLCQRLRTQPPSTACLHDLFSHSFNFFFHSMFLLPCSINMSNRSVQNMVGEANTHNLTFVLQELNLFPDLTVLAQPVELCFSGWAMSPSVCSSCALCMPLSDILSQWVVMDYALLLDCHFQEGRDLSTMHGICLERKHFLISI